MIRNRDIFYEQADNLLPSQRDTDNIDDENYLYKLSKESSSNIIIGFHENFSQS